MKASDASRGLPLFLSPLLKSFDEPAVFHSELIGSNLKGKHFLLPRQH
jgi:hypothetical protein